MGAGLEDNEYVAVGFSLDDKMGEDFVFACTSEGVALSYNGMNKKNFFVELLAEGQR